jgi:hypothetical protein
VFDADLNQSVATVCAVCGRVDSINVLPELPLELPRPVQLGIYDSVVDDLGVAAAPVDYWPADLVAVRAVRG